MNKHIKVMADFLSTGLWIKNPVSSGYIPLEYSEIPISERLKIQLENWVAWYDSESLDYLESDEENRSHIYFFSEIGLAIAKQLKRELPDYKIQYFDESRYGIDNTESYYLYEIEV